MNLIVIKYQQVPKSQTNKPQCFGQSQKLVEHSSGCHGLRLQTKKFGILYIDMYWC